MKRIAIVEDNPLFNEALYRTLVKAGYEVVRAYTLAEGMRLIDSSISLMIIDINLPDGEGLAICKKAHGYNQIPVIFLTARDEEADMLKAFELGADNYLVKPFPMPVLLKAIAALLRRTEEDSDTFVYMDLKMDFERMHVTYKDVEIRLTPKEYKLLELLVRNKGRVVTKSMILEHVWDREGAFVEENTVNVTLNRLKKKIEPDTSNPVFIKNVFGLGYTFGK